MANRLPAAPSDRYLVPSGDDAPFAIPEDEIEERRDARVGWIVIGLFFGLFLGFASFIRLDAAAEAQGSVKVAGNRQAVQHRDGGVVTALHVREGQIVHSGDILVEVASAELGASERALAGQALGLLAERARLEAERAGTTQITPPIEFAALTAEDKPLAQESLRIQASVLATRRRSLVTQKQVLAQQAAQLGERVGGLTKQMSASELQDKLYGDQLVGIQEIAKKGFASINRVRELERARAAMSGELANLSAERASTRQQIGETRLRVLSADADALRDVSDQLHKVQDSLNEVMPKWAEARHQLEATRIRATATGQVVGLSIFTVGGVIAPGQKLMEIVPTAAPLVVEARVQPSDADDLYVGQVAELRFLALHERNMPVFEGKISRLSADSFTDEHTGQTYFTCEVTVPAADIARIRDIKGQGDGIKPGLPVEVLVPLRKRTMLQYLFEPLSQLFWRSGREH